MTVLHVISDLHTEVYPYEIDKKALELADVIVMAGDISDNPAKVSEWIKDQGIGREKPILYVHGNHEWYASPPMHIQGESFEWRSHAATLNRESGVFLFDEYQTKYIFKDIMFVGVTLWTDYKGNNPANEKYYRQCAEQGMNDYVYMLYEKDVNVTTEHLSERHEAHKLAIKKNFEGWKGKRVVISHHLPSWRCINKRYENSPLNPCFASNLDDMIRELDIDLWIHGHTHSSHDFDLGKCRIVCNPRGYTSARGSENKDFNPQYLIEI